MQTNILDVFFYLLLFPQIATVVGIYPRGVILIQLGYSQCRSLV